MNSIRPSVCKRSAPYLQRRSPQRLQSVRPLP